MLQQQCTVRIRGAYLRIRVAPLRLMRHIDEHAMSYMVKMLQFNRQQCCCDVHDCCFSAGAALLHAELVPHVAVAPLLHVDGNLQKKCQQKNSFTEQRHTGQEGAGGHVTWVPRGFVRTSTWALSVRGQCKGWRRDQTETQPSKKNT